MLLVVGDWNAKVGQRQTGEEGIVGNDGLMGETSSNGERFVAFCATNKFVNHVSAQGHPQLHLDLIHQMANTATRSIMWPLTPGQTISAGRQGV